ncbi:hypothetical protein BDL97_08G035300 [Sphagnum fallax]|nr:hypothetical protein BDL97_08G035300 [Sphagnum fallax]
MDTCFSSSCSARFISAAKVQSLHLHAARLPRQQQLHFLNRTFAVRKLGRACGRVVAAATGGKQKQPVETANGGMISAGEASPGFDGTKPSVTKKSVVSNILFGKSNAHVDSGFSTLNGSTAVDHSIQIDPLGVSTTAAAAAWLCDALEKVLVWMFVDTDQQGKNPSSSSQFFLTGHYAPVSETDPTSNLAISGSIPECLNGEFVHVTPNPKFNPVAYYHWFDGDGMLHGLRIKDGKATYVARFVKTSRLQQEEYYGAAKFIKLGDMQGVKGIFFSLVFNLRVKLKVIDISNGYGTGNTALVYHNKQLLVLHENDFPYVIRVLENGDLETIGRKYLNPLATRFTAHPKIDPFTGEMFGLYWDFMELPYCTYQIFSKEGILMEPVPITIPEGIMIHDFAITENYAIFLDLSLLVNPKHFVEGEHVYKFDASKESRIGLLPRYAKNESQIRWFIIPTCMIFHLCNAWEEADEIVLIACRMSTIDFTYFIDFHQDKANASRALLYEFRMNMKTGKVTQKQLSTLTTEFPEINDKYTGRKQRYVYGSIMDDMLKIVGVAKYDLSLELELGTRDLKIGGNIKGLFLHGDGRQGSEPIFVPRTPSKELLEDDGYLICFVYDKKVGCSEMVIIDAKTMASKPVGVINLPTRVPSGLHSIFLSEEQLNNQG